MVGHREVQEAGRSGSFAEVCRNVEQAIDEGHLS